MANSPRSYYLPRWSARFVCLAVVASWTCSTASLAKPPRGLPAALGRILNRPALRCAHVGAIVVGLPRGEVWYQSNADRLFVPASNAKLFVAAAALDRLGPDFHYQTVVLAEREPESGVLQGDLFLKGSGDPALMFVHLADLAERLRKKGLSHVTGRVVGDESAFDSVRRGAGWMYEDLPWYYAPEISAVSLNGNSVVVVVKPGAARGDSPRVTVSPPTSYLRIENRAETGSGHSAALIVIDRPFGLPVITVQGSITPGSRPVHQRVSVPNPALWAAHVFRERLLACGVRIDGEAAVGMAPAETVALAGHESPPLHEIIGTMLNNSDNHIAEQLLKTLGARLEGPGVAGSGLDVVRQFLNAAGVASGCSPHLADGSGLSRYNLASPRHIALLLCFMDRHPRRSAWLEAFPVAGVSGTLEHRMTASPTRAAVRAKTGTMFGVSALSGYAATRSGERAVFSLLVNNFTGPVRDVRQAQDDVVAAIAGMR